jgi:hypothetical protein
MVVVAESVQWFATLTEEERRACAEELTDTYIAALTTGEWDALHRATQAWMQRAADARLVTA